MNRGIIFTAFENITKAFKRHSNVIKTNLELYRATTAEIKSTYSQSVAEQKIADMKESARATVVKADAELNATVHAEVKKLRGKITEMTTMSVPHEWVNQMKTIRDFDLPMTIDEVRAYAEAYAGNYSALRVLQKVASEKGFSVAVPSVEELQKGLKKVESLACAPVMYVPDGFYKEAREFYPDVPLYREDGSIYGTRGRPEVTYLVTRANLIASMLRDISEGGEIYKVWTASGPVSVTVSPGQIGDKLKEGATVEGAQREADKLARAAFAENLDIAELNDLAHNSHSEAKQAEEYDRIMKHYTR